MSPGVFPHVSSSQLVKDVVGDHVELFRHADQSINHTLVTLLLLQHSARWRRIKVRGQWRGGQGGAEAARWAHGVVGTWWTAASRSARGGWSVRQSNGQARVAGV